MGALTEATSIQDAAKAALDTIKTEFEWAYGSYWIVDEKDNALKFAVESGAVNVSSGASRWDPDSARGKVFPAAPGRPETCSSPRTSAR